MRHFGTIVSSRRNAPGGRGCLIRAWAATLLPPVVTHWTELQSQVGSVYSALVTATNSPTSFGAVGLPAGLSIDPATGWITGTPTLAGTGTFTVSATNAAGTGTLVVPYTVRMEIPIITSGSTVTGWVGTAFSYTITATGSPKYPVLPLPAAMAITLALLS